MPSQFLSFRLGGAEYGIDMLLPVQEVRSYENPTRIANASHFIKNVVKVRGRVCGVVVDSGSDMLALGADSIKPAPEMNAAVATRHIIGMGCVAGVDVERMLIHADAASQMRGAGAMNRTGRVFRRLGQHPWLNSHRTSTKLS